MKLRQQISLALISVAVVAVLLSSLVLGGMSVSAIKTTSQSSTERQLKSLRQSMESQVENLIHSMQSQIETLANNTQTIQALEGFVEGWEVVDSPDDQAYSRLSDYYSQQFAPVFQQKNGHRPDIPAILPPQDDIAAAWQSLYIGNSAYPLGEKDNLVDPGDGSLYSYYHSVYHPKFKGFLEAFGYYDIFLIEPTNGRVVYSVFKELDFASSVFEGPFAQSGLGQVTRAVLASERTEAVAFSAYLPSYNAQAAFIAAPVFSEWGGLAGIIAFQFPLHNLTEILSFDGQWQEQGFGLTGEAYLVDARKQMLGESRPFIENPTQFREAAKATQISPRIIDEIQKQNSTFALLPVNTDAAQVALAGRSEMLQGMNYLGTEVLSAVAPIEFFGQQWALIVEFALTELQADSKQMVSRIILWSALIVVAITLVVALSSYWFSARLSGPIRALSDSIAQASQHRDLTVQVAHTKRRDEVGVAASQFDQFLATLRQIIGELSRTASEVQTASQQGRDIAIATEGQVNHQRGELGQLATGMGQMTASISEVAEQSHLGQRTAENFSKQVSDGRDLSKSNQQTVAHLADEISAANGEVQSLKELSSSITGVIDVISSIADQTNLLALNAAIEAARAGEQGRGFAVVADEVRSLAARTQESTHQIKDTIEALLSQTDSASDRMQHCNALAEQGQKMALETAEVLDAINDGMQSLNDINALVATAAEEQSHTSRTMNDNVHSVNEAAAQTGAAMHDLAASAEKLQAQSLTLQKAVSSFRI